jgi:hypothetical protein
VGRSRHRAEASEGEVGTRYDVRTFFFFPGQNLSHSHSLHALPRASL